MRWPELLHPEASSDSCQSVGSNLNPFFAMSRTLHRTSAFLVVASAILSLPHPGQAQQTQQRGPPTAVAESGPEVGEMAPEFTLPWATQDSVGPRGQPFRLGHRRGKVVVLAFFPRDFTSGCTAEMRTFADQYRTLFGDSVEVVGISVDSVATHVRFAASLKLPFLLLSDPGQVVAKQYGSNGSEGTMRRTVYVLDRDGRVAYRNLRFGALDPQSYDELKAAVREVRGS
jgi:peroxiredoxin Q/BCP